MWEGEGGDKIRSPAHTIQNQFQVKDMHKNTAQKLLSDSLFNHHGKNWIRQKSSIDAEAREKFC